MVAVASQLSLHWAEGAAVNHYGVSSRLEHHEGDTFVVFSIIIVMMML